MEYGLIQSSNAIAWLKTEKRKFFYFPKLSPDSVTLSALSMLRGSAVVAYNCRECKKIIVDYGDPTSDLNFTPPKGDATLQKDEEQAAEND